MATDPPPIPPNGDDAVSPVAARQPAKKSSKTTNKGWATIMLTALTFAATIYADPAKAKDPIAIGAALGGLTTGIGLIQAKDED